MNNKKIFELIERNSQLIEESSKNGLVAHHVDVDGLINDLMAFNNINYTEVCAYCKIKPKSNGSDYCGNCIDNGNYK